MTQDLNKGISDIAYNSLNLPRIVDIKNKTTEGRNEYTYSAAGQKLRAIQKWNPNYNTSPVIGSAVNTTALTQLQTTDYVGNKIYENNILKRILVDGGYYEAGNYYFYITDHLGNNRIVANAAASVVQSTQYYPFGTSFADATNADAQPYKYNGKELDKRNGLNMYDYSARWKDDFRFTTVDPLAEKYYSMSPYVYCGNNPMRFIDPTGMDSIVYNQKGELSGRFKMDGDDRHYMLHEKGEQGVLRVLSQESITGDPREKMSFNGTLNENFTLDKQKEIINEGIKNIDGYLSIISESSRGALDYKKHFEAGELINLNGIYMNNHEALNYLWGASMNEIMASGKAGMGVGDALIGAQLFHNYDSVFGRSEGFFNQSNHNEAIKFGWWNNESRSRPHRPIPPNYKH